MSTTTLDPATGKTLAGLARRAVEAAVSAGGREARLGADELAGLPAELAAPGACFVTLRRRGRLLGCIGTMEPSRPLAADAVHNAWAAAFADPRLPAVTEADLPELEVEVSVLGPLEPLEVADRAGLVAALRPGLDGLLVEAGARRATFLPAVWHQLPEPDAFLDHLWDKAGLRPGTWPSGLRLWRYSATEFTA